MAEQKRGPHDSLVPFNDLLECAVVAIVGWEAVREDEGARPVATAISTMWVFL